MKLHRDVLGLTVLSLVVATSFAACGSSTTDRTFGTEDGGDPDAAFADDGAIVNPDGGFVKTDEAGLPVGETRDPKDCAEAKTSKSYVGCDYWPTVTANNVWSIFDFAVVVANTGTAPADVTITGPNATNKQVTVPPGELRKIPLKWVPALKGADWDQCTAAVPMPGSVLAAGGAYHLVSSTPVIVYQFNALEYKNVGGEAPAGGPKDWSSCPGTTTTCSSSGGPVGCFSYSNDASLLLPSTAMTGNYRVLGQHGWTEAGLFGGSTAVMGAYVTVTATQNDTHVTMSLSTAGKVLGGGGVTATAGGGKVTLTLQAGDVAEIVADKGKAFDLSGSLVQADKPVQVISGIPCINLPAGTPACDHVEETILPAETLGKRYAVPVPTAPKGNFVAHNVRFYGNVDGTTLTYNPSKPTKCPATLNAGEVVDCETVNADFEVTGTHEFGVSTFTLGASMVDPDPNPGPFSTYRSKGDPAQSMAVAVEQFRTKYLFLAPDDYTTSYVDIVGTSDSDVILDGAPITATFKAIGAGPLGIFRVKLGAGQGGAHSLTSKKPVGIQVLGYGEYTSYQYPGGLNLELIAPPPPPPK
jgi:hypothetical protein